jgi:hypothetical protein
MAVLAASPGCTAGEIIDSHNNVITNPGAAQIIFQNQDTGVNYSVLNDHGKFSFDPYGPATWNNDKVMVPDGNYKVQVYDLNGVTYTSRPFHHQFFTTCTDSFTQQSEPCALYRLKVYTYEEYCPFYWCPIQQYPPMVDEGGDKVIPVTFY